MNSRNGFYVTLALLALSPLVSCSSIQNQSQATKNTTVDQAKFETQEEQNNQSKFFKNQSLSANNKMDRNSGI